jgi:hypothetical protein
MDNKVQPTNRTSADSLDQAAGNAMDSAPIQVRQWALDVITVAHPRPPDEDRRPKAKKAEGLKEMISMWRVTSHGMRYIEPQPERWCYTSEQAEAEVKARLGVERFHDYARKTRSEMRDAPTCEFDGFTWTCAHRREYSQMPRSNKKQDEYGFVRIDRMERPSPPFVHPFPPKP